MKLSKKVKLYLIEKGGSIDKQKEVATELAVLAPSQYTNAVLTGENGVALGADLLENGDLVTALKQELAVLELVNRELSINRYYTKLVAENYLKQRETELLKCLNQLESEKK